MKRYFVKSIGFIVLLSSFTSFAFAQDEKPSNEIRNGEVIVIRKKGDKDAKVTVEIKDGEVKVNGKPLSEFNDDNVTVRKQGQRMYNNGESFGMIAPVAPTSPFRSGGDVFFNRTSNGAFLGVLTDEDENGARVKEVTKGSAAEKAGLKEGDVITKVEDKTIKDPSDLTEAVASLKPESKVAIVYKRDKKEQKVTATLGTRPGRTMILPRSDVNLHDFPFDFNYETFGKGRFGIKAQDTEDGKGVKVLSVEDNSNAGKAGIKEGDIIQEFNGEEVNTATELSQAARDARDENNVKVKILRDGKTQNLEIKIPKKLKTADL